MELAARPYRMDHTHPIKHSWPQTICHISDNHADEHESRADDMAWRYLDPWMAFGECGIKAFAGIQTQQLADQILQGQADTVELT